MRTMNGGFDRTATPFLDVEVEVARPDLRRVGGDVDLRGVTGRRGGGRRNFGRVHQMPVFISISPGGGSPHMHRFTWHDFSDHARE